MTAILTWNIQNGKGVDGRVSLSRIADVIAAMGDPEVICLQEVSRGLPLDGGAGAPDQIAELSALFPAHEVVFGAAVDALLPGAGTRWQFGNAVLSRLPLLSLSRHPLPRPGAGGGRCMTRQATEVVVDLPRGPLRIVNVHLEYHSEVHRRAQVVRLRELQQEAMEADRNPPQTDADGPYRHVPRPAAAVLCGDFNLRHGSPEYRQLLAPLAGEAAPFSDAWEIAHPGRASDPTCGVHDRTQWPEGPHCRDFFFVAGGCAAAVRDVRVDTRTDASDHQPLMLQIDGGGAGVKRG